MSATTRGKLGDRPILLAAGGTGGHLFPAEALARALEARGVPVELMTDDRALRYGVDFPARALHAVPSATPRAGSPVAKAAAAAQLSRGVLAAWRILGRVKPAAVVGFGGYPTVPPIVAASIRSLPILLHEQNAVMGKANLFVANRAIRIATGFPALGKVPAALLDRVRFTGNPVRPAVIAASQTAMPLLTPDGPIHLLVTGGSQGARVMSDVVPAAIEKLDPGLRARLAIVQQARGEDEARVRDAYARIGVDAEVAPFFADLPQRIAAAHIVVGRAGASTVSEIAVIGRAAILVPFPHALDQDQAANAAILAQSGAAVVRDQALFTPEWLAEELARVLNDPADLLVRADAARHAGRPDAAERLCELVLDVVGGQV